MHLFVLNVKAYWAHVPACSQGHKRLPMHLFLSKVKIIRHIYLFVFNDRKVVGLCICLYSSPNKYWTYVSV